MKKLSIIFLLVISCSTWDTRLSLSNNSSQKINYYYLVTDIDDYTSNIKYCDETSLSSINENSTQILRAQDKWNFTLGNHPNKKLRVWIINSDTLTKYGTCEVFKNKNFIETLDFSYEDLIKIKWKINYDGKSKN